MTTTVPDPDIFTNVHKGIRTALFDACAALGRAGRDPALGASARARLREALRFVAHHGENEDALLLPLLEQTAPEVFGRIERAHVAVNGALEILQRSIDASPPDELYHRTCAFTALYLEHMCEEECDLEPLIRAAVSTEQLAGIASGSVARTAAADQRMMLSFMVRAMPRGDAAALCARLPTALRQELLPLIGNDV
jgi:hypothetical protein